MLALLHPGQEWGGVMEVSCHFHIHHCVSKVINKLRGDQIFPQHPPVSDIRQNSCLEPVIPPLFLSYSVSQSLYLLHSSGPLYIVA